MSFVDLYSRFLSKYQNPELTKRELVRVTQQYKGLEVRQESYVFTDGKTLELVNLQGTIPVPFKGTFYNIPIIIWLMDTHPNNAPICYLRPTSNMKIVVSMHVDHNGKVYLPYLHDWTPASELLSLIQVMIMKFSEQPPLFQTRVENNPPVIMPTNRYMGMSMPEYTSWPSGSGSSNPPYPPYPNTSTPPYPTVPQSYPPYPPASYPTQTPYPPYPPQPASGYHPPIATQPQPNIASNSGASSGTITGEHIRASLFSAVEDKLRRRVREQFLQGEAELKTLIRTKEELQMGKERLDHLINKLDYEQKELEKNISILHDKENELDGLLDKLTDENSTVDVDEAVTTTAPLYKQLLTAFAEEAATEDVIYYLGEALRRGVIDLDVFLKHVRRLSHKQFMLRALMQKCRAKAGLPG